MFCALISAKKTIFIRFSKLGDELRYRFAVKFPFFYSSEMGGASAQSQILLLNSVGNPEPVKN
jgi:hypothetical protein